jgi:hypothetical protein
MLHMYIYLSIVYYIYLSFIYPCFPIFHLYLEQQAFPLSRYPYIGTGIRSNDHTYVIIIHIPLFPPDFIFDSYSMALTSAMSGIHLFV